MSINSGVCPGFTIAMSDSDCQILPLSGGGTCNTPLNQQSPSLPFHQPFPKDVKVAAIAESSQLCVSIDWISLSIPIYSSDGVETHVQYLTHTLVDEFVLTPGRPAPVVSGVLYSHTGRSTRGCTLRWNLPNDSKDGKGRLLIQINGKSLQPLNFLERIDILMTFLDIPGSRLTRIDMALDDYSRKLTFENLYDAERANNYSGFNVSCRISSKKRGGDAGNTLSFGSRHSGNYLRIYDKGVESGGRIDAIRLELEVKSGKAAQVGALIYETIGYDEQGLKQLFVDLILGSIDFIERRTDCTNLARMKRLDWWQEFIDFVAAVPLKVSLPKAERTLDKTRNWLHHQVCTSLAMLHKVYGERQYKQIMLQLLEDGRSRFTDFHEAIIRQGQKLNRIPILA